MPCQYVQPVLSCLRLLSICMQYELTHLSTCSTIYPSMRSRSAHFSKVALLINSSSTSNTNREKKISNLRFELLFRFRGSGVNTLSISALRFDILKQKNSFQIHLQYFFVICTAIITFPTWATGYPRFKLKWVLFHYFRRLFFDFVDGSDYSWITPCLFVCLFFRRYEEVL